ncbi:MAG: NTP transferase domain-containing protein [Planctomycetes bacterium]|nr:NTP transferase domain-containing protein [Planctomycetota bacterium]
MPTGEKISIRKVVIPVAGAGTRLLPVTKSQPKEMLPVGRKPVVQYVVEEMQRADLSEILFVTGRQKTSIEDHFDHDQELVRKLSEAGRSELLAALDYEDTDAGFFFVRQRELKGLADAVATGRNFVGEEPFVVALGDSIIKDSGRGALMSDMIDAFTAKHAAAVIAVEEVPADMVHHYGIVSPKGQASPGEVFEIDGMVEKPSPEEAKSHLAIAARYVFDPVIFEAIDRTVPQKGGELQLTDSVQILLNWGKPVYCMRLAKDQRRYDIGNFESYFKAFVDFAMDDEKYGYIVRQHIIRGLQAE